MRLFFVITLVFALQSCTSPDSKIIKDIHFIKVEAATYNQLISNTEINITEDFYISEKPISVDLYKEFNPDFDSRGSDSTAIFVSWNDAKAFCEWFSYREGLPVRLPTEAEWELAHIAQPQLTLHSLFTENWCYGNYGPLTNSKQINPAGYDTGDIKSVRGGVYFKNDTTQTITYRLGSLPDDRNRKIGFRIVISEGENVTYQTREEKSNPANISQASIDWKSVSIQKPIFLEPIPFVKIDTINTGLFTQHNHCPSITWTKNGDLLATWYSTINEGGREHLVASSRLKYGTNSWDTAKLFWDTPGRNDHATAIYTQKDGTILHFNGFDVDTYWDELALFLRKSFDNGATWTSPKIIMPEHSLRHMPIASVFEGSDGTLYLPCDATTLGNGGTALLISKDGGESWVDHGEGKEKPVFEAGKTGAWIAGIHAGVVETEPGKILAFGRGDNINGKMPQSYSEDGGKTWTYSASPFEPISGGQRLVLKSLSDGGILFFSFTKGMNFSLAGRKIYGEGGFVALSYDNGKTWPFKRLLTDGKTRTLDGKAWTDEFIMDENHAEPKGYFTAVQSPDNLIHLISSGIHYRFNTAWVKEGK